VRKEQTGSPDRRGGMELGGQISLVGDSIEVDKNMATLGMGKRKGVYDGEIEEGSHYVQRKSETRG